MTKETIKVAEIADCDTRGAGWWVSGADEGQIDMTGVTLAQAKAALLEQCADESQRQGILAGSIEIAE